MVNILDGAPGIDTTFLRAAYLSRGSNATYSSALASPEHLHSSNIPGIPPPQTKT